MLRKLKRMEEKMLIGTKEVAEKEKQMMKMKEDLEDNKQR